MKYIHTFESFLNEKKDEKYTARIEDSRKPGGSDKDIKKNYGLDVENRDRDGFDIVGTKEDVEAFIEDYGVITDVEVYESAEANMNESEKSIKSGQSIIRLMDRYNPQLGNYYAFSKVNITRVSPKSVSCDDNAVYDGQTGERKSKSSAGYGSASYRIFFSYEEAEHEYQELVKGGNRVNGWDIIEKYKDELYENYFMNESEKSVKPNAKLKNDTGFPYAM